jgi:hypothetical protein
MENIEFSFVSFDECVVNRHPNRNIERVLKRLAGEKTVPVLYNYSLMMAADDCRDMIAFLQLNLRRRIENNPGIGQVLIILYDSPIFQGLAVQTKAFNRVSFTSDLRGWAPRDEKIEAEYGLDTYRASNLVNMQGIEESQAQSRYIDNYLFFLALKDIETVGADALLVYTSSEIELNSLVDLCRTIAKHKQNPSAY